MSWLQSDRLPTKVKAEFVMLEYSLPWEDMAIIECCISFAKLVKKTCSIYTTPDGHLENELART